MCCNCGKGYVIVSAGTYILIQSLTYGILACMGIAFYNCAYIENLPAIGPLYFTYFFDISGCKAGRDLFTNEPAIAEFKLPDSIPPSERNVKFMESYAALSLLWTVSSIFLLASLFLKKHSKFNLCIYIFFVLIGIGNLILDLIAIGVYSSDFESTWTLKDYLTFLGFENIGDLQSPLPDGTTSVPTIIMVALFARGGFLWIANLSVVISIIRMSCSSYKKGNERRYTRRPQNNWRNQLPRNQIPVNHDSVNSIAFISMDKPIEDRSIDSSVNNREMYSTPSAPQYQNNHIPDWETPPSFPPEPSTPDWERNRRPRPSYEPRPSFQSSDPSILSKSSMSSEMPHSRLNYNSQDSLDEWEPNPRPSNDYQNRADKNMKPDRQRPNIKKKPRLPETPMPIRPSWDRSSASSIASHGGTGSNTPSSLAMGSRAGSKSSRETLDDIPSGSATEEYHKQLEKVLSKRPQPSPPRPNPRPDIREQSKQIQPSRVLGAPPSKYNDAMRSSRPWSYFYPEEPALPPRRYNAEHHDDEQDEDLPPVPVPDYTLHFPSKRTYAPLKM